MVASSPGKCRTGRLIEPFIMERKLHMTNNERSKKEVNATENTPRVRELTMEEMIAISGGRGGATCV